MSGWYFSDGDNLTSVDLIFAQVCMYLYVNIVLSYVNYGPIKLIDTRKPDKNQNIETDC